MKGCIRNCCALFRQQFYISLTIVYYVPRRIMRFITRRATMLAGDRSRDKANARSVLQALSRVSQFPELCALEHILFYVISVRIRVFMRTLESNLVFIMILVHCT